MSLKIRGATFANLFCSLGGKVLILRDPR
jgi:hypothetical protein